MRRAIAATSDAVSQRLAPIATTLGRAFGVDAWYVDLFAEEVVRGGPAFAVSLVLSAVEPALRASAELGAWQLISPGDAVGRVTVVSGLHEVQDEVKASSCRKFLMSWILDCSVELLAITRPRKLPNASTETPALLSRFIVHGYLHKPCRESDRPVDIKQ